VSRLGVLVPSGRGRLWRSGPPRPGTDRPAGHGKADASLDQSTPCSQSQIGQDPYLGEGRTAQLGPGLALSVAVRSKPVMTVVNGTLVARPASTMMLQTWR
jgi:hypothetical protein